MERNVHKNYILASNLIFVILALSLLELLLPDVHIMAGGLAIMIGIKIFLFVAGILVRQGYGWTKYLVLLLGILTLTSIPQFIMNMPYITIPDVIGVIQVVLIIWACVVLLKIPKTERNR